MLGYNRSGYQGEQNFISNRSASSKGGFAFYDYGNDGTMKHLMTIDGTGNVGIGTNTPTTQLDVAGTISTSGPIYASGTVNTHENLMADWYIIAKEALIASNNRDTGGTLVLENSSKTGTGQASQWKIYNMTGSYGNSLQFWAYDNAGTVYHSRFTITDAGNVGIGRSDPYYKLDVYGTIRAREVKVNLNSGADFVFEKDYNLMPLGELSRFVSENKHLPDIAPAAEMTSGDTDLGEMQVKLLQKVEELTLYIIQQNSEIENLKAEINLLKKK